MLEHTPAPTPSHVKRKQPTTKSSVPTPEPAKTLTPSPARRKYPAKRKQPTTKLSAHTPKPAPEATHALAP